MAKYALRETPSETDALTGYAPLLSRLLIDRGITTNTEAETFLLPDYEHGMHDPYLMHDMEKAVVRMYEAIEGKEKIVIYSDYDCDGIPGAVIMHDLLKKVGCTTFEVYIPHRHDEGYGLHQDAVESFIQNGVQLLFTIDLGITAVAEVSHAQINGVDVIVTDHHLPQAEIPKAYAVVNPKLGSYPDPMLCGAGVAFKFVQAFLSKYGEYYSVPKGWEKWLLDMAGLATLSDMVPLKNENRIIAAYGMMVLRKSPRPGLQSLLAAMKIDQRYLSEDDIGFMVTPRINAASRMDEPMRAFELLATTDPVEARALASHLGKINDERKTLVATIMKQTYATLEKRELRDIIVIGNPEWRAGVLGLVAGKICDEYGKTAFVWGHENGDDDILKGSCRSSGGVNIVALMTAAAGSFDNFGGHAGAGGFSISKTEVHFLEDRLTEALSSMNLPTGEEKQTFVDAQLSLSDITLQTYELLEKLAPFGCENPKPTFLFKNVTIADIKLFGKEKNHLELSLVETGVRPIKAIKFFAGLDSFGVPIEKGKAVDLVGTFELSRFAGKKELRLRIEDIS